LSEKIGEDNVKKVMLSLTMVLATGLIGCPKNPDLTAKAPPQQKEPIGNKVVQPPAPPAPKGHDRYTQGADLVIPYDPKVDILFVMDTSDSMFCDQQKLNQNIDKFTNGFLTKQGRFLDFHVGAVSVWDSQLYGNAKRDCEIGELRPVGGGKCSDHQGKDNFVTRETSKDPKQLAKILGNTIKVGIEPYISKGSNPTPEFLAERAATSGPETEELFSPVLAALSPQGSKLNPNFRRPGVPLAVVFVTDTDDMTPSEVDSQGKVLSYMKGSEMAMRLKELAGDKVSVSTYAVLARYNDLLKFESDSYQFPLLEYKESGLKNCQGTNDKVDPLLRGAGMAPFKMRELLVSMQGGKEDSGFDLGDANYGEKLTQLGASITKKSLRKVIILDYPRDINESLIVKYGKNQVIPEDNQKGWTFTVENGVNKVILNDGLELEPEDGATITIEYTPVK
jgi:hypothetical protein